MAASVFVARLVSPLQWIKFVHRVAAKNVNDHIPAHYQEVYLFSFILLEFSLLIANANSFVLISLPKWLVTLFCVWRVLESVGANFYHLVLRPIVSERVPHSIYRSFLLALAGLLEVWFVLALLWYFSQFLQVDNVEANVIQSLYYVLATFVTIGGGMVGYDANISEAVALEIFTILAGVAMISMIVARAIALLPTLGYDEQKPE